MASRTADLEGPVHHLDFGGEGPPLVCVHGLAGSALNWTAIAPGLAARHRVLAPDLRGFGRTPLGPGSRLRDNQRLLDRFLREVAGVPATIVANSMGGLLALRQAAARPETVRSMILVDPALPWRHRRRLGLPLLGLFAALMTPGLGVRWLRHRARRLGAEGIVAQVLALVCADPSRLAPEVVRAHVESTREWLALPHGPRALAQATRSLVWALLRGGQRRTFERVRTPVLIVHGDRDRLVPVAFSLAIGHRYGWPVEVFPGVGHAPMLEAPDDLLRVTMGWLSSLQPAAA